MPATLLKKRLWQRCFPVNFEKSEKHFFYKTHPVATSNVNNSRDIFFVTPLQIRIIKQIRNATFTY